MNQRVSAAASNVSPWTADLGNGSFQNPVLYADYSDPDVIRVGEDFYMVASSFSHLPGLPIVHSKDLVNWTIISYVINKLDLPGYDQPQHGKGVWAPSIRFHANKFWVFFSTPDEGIFMSTADHPRGPWTPLHMIKEVKGWIDPCPFWDEDGLAYLVHAFAHSRCGVKHKLQVCRMSADGKELLDEGQLIYDGTAHHPTMEGPKMYKRNGYYYVFTPAGGVSTGWQTILRAKSIYGPYEDKIVLHQGDSPVNGPHQGGWVELESGESWFLHFQDREAYGRIVHLQPVNWVDDWPLMGIDTNSDGIGEPVLQAVKPNVGRIWPVAVPAMSDNFNTSELGLQWQWQANPQNGWYSLTDNPGHLRLFTHPLSEGAATLYDVPQLLLQKFPAPSFTVTTRLDFHPAAGGDKAGLMVFGEEYAYVALSPSSDEGMQLTYYRGQSRGGTSSEYEAASVPVSSASLYLRVSITGDAECLFSYSMDGVDYRPIGDVFLAKPGRWVGAKVGVFSVNTGQPESPPADCGHADFDWFEIK